MDLDPYSFDLPDERIARYPVEPPDASRLMYLDGEGNISHHIFRSLPGLLHEEDVLVFNRTRVSNRRVRLHRANGTEFEALFLESSGSPAHWMCMIRRSARLKEGEVLERGRTAFRFAGRQGPLCRLEAIEQDAGWKSLEAAEAFFAREGEPPIPPYLGRAADDTDRRRYQTIFADNPGSVAAPTAGLHFTHPLLEELGLNHMLVYVDLTIGYGTFAPLTPENFAQKRLHREGFHIPEGTAAALNAAVKDGRRIVSVGTTTLRSLESVHRQHGQFRAGSFDTDLFLFPPDHPSSCNALITNFHLPASSLFMLVCAFAGTDRVQAAYSTAIQEGYRFYSYGDAMLLDRPGS